jgi:chitinase
VNLELGQPAQSTPYRYAFAQPTESRGGLRRLAAACLKALPGCLLACLGAQLAFAAQPKEVIAYIFPSDSALQPSDIAAGKLTRVNYAFANIRHGEIVEGFGHDAENFAVLHALKRKNSGLKVLVSVGGWTWSGGFSDMALTAASRRKFIDSAARFIEKYELDGLDVDWEYPGLPGIGNRFRPEDKENYTALLRELRTKFDHEQKRLGRPLFTSLAAGASLHFLEQTNMREVARYVDTVNLMSYDYYEPSSSPITGNHAPLYTDPADPNHISADASVAAFLAAGVPGEKLVLGVPFYGHAWSGVADIAHGLFQPGKNAKLQANYHDIVTLRKNGGYVRYWDTPASAPYLYNAASHIFISYEDPESLRLKSGYVLTHKLGGIMFWEYSADADGALLDAINASLRGALQ